MASTDTVYLKQPLEFRGGRVWNNATGEPLTVGLVPEIGHVFAAAPDLLAALEDVQGEIECRYDGAVDSNTLWLGRSLEIIDKAIAKARGEA